MTADDYYHDPIWLPGPATSRAARLIELGAEVIDFDSPLVSIGLPTFNGAAHLSEALDSLVAQDYTRLEILISDNGSTDDTFAIAAAYAERDPRIRVIRQATNVGALENFNLVFRETSGPLFMWAADDDCWEPRYVSACVRALQLAPAAVLACTKLSFFGDLDPVYVDRFDQFDNPDLSTPSVEERMRRLLSRHGWYAIYGLIRRDDLGETRLFRPGFGADVVLLAELALRGPFSLVDESLYRYRATPIRPPERSPWSGLDDRRRATPYSHLQEAVAEAIATSGIPWPDRARAWRGMIRAAFLDRSPLRSWIGIEVRARLRMAVIDRDGRSLAKYGTLTLERAWRRLGRSAQTFVMRMKPGIALPEPPAPAAAIDVPDEVEPRIE